MAGGVAIDVIDGLSSAVAIKGPAELMTTGNIELYGEQVIDTVQTESSRVLVAAQTDETQNGIYVTGPGPWRRAKDFSRNNDVVPGTQVYVVSGDVNGGVWYTATYTGELEFGTTAITFFASNQGTGDVVGPSSATDGNFAAFDTTTGKLIKDSGKSAADFATAAQGGKADTAVQPGDLGNSAGLDVGTTLGTVASGSDARLRDLATASNWRAGTDTAKALGVKETWDSAAYVNLGATLTGNLTLDLGSFIYGYGTATGNITFNAVSNPKNQSGLIEITASGGDRTVGFNTSAFCTPDNEAIDAIPSGKTVQFSYARTQGGKVELIRIGEVA